MTFDDPDGYTALHEAARKGDLAQVRDLLEQGADPELPTIDGWTPFTLACSAYVSACMGGPGGILEKADDYMDCALALAGGERERVMAAVRYYTRNR